MCLGNAFNASWGLLGVSWGILGASWGLLGASWGILGASWGILEASWGILGPSCGVLEASWTVLEATKNPEEALDPTLKNAAMQQSYGRGARERKETVYNDGLTDKQFTALVENSSQDDFEKNLKKRISKNKREAAAKDERAKEAELQRREEGRINEQRQWDEFRHLQQRITLLQEEVRAAHMT